MEGLLLGYADDQPAGPSKRARSHSIGDNGDDGSDENHEWAREQRRAAKRQRKRAEKEERSKKREAKEERRAARKLAKQSLPAPEDNDDEGENTLGHSGQYQDDAEEGGADEEAVEETQQPQREDPESPTLEPAASLPEPEDADQLPIDPQLMESPEPARKKKRAVYTIPSPKASKVVKAASRSNRDEPPAEEVPEAGPSRTKSVAKAPKASRQSTAASSTSGRGGNQKSEKETDEELRRRFSNPGAMNAWIASKWISYNELRRLEAAGILTYRKGQFSQAEKDALKQHFTQFKHMNRLDDEDLVSMVMAKGTTTDRKDFGQFWPDAALVVPGRPVKSVKDHIQRELDPRGRKGAWTAEEDRALLRAYNINPDEWIKIASVVDRTEFDCRDRYKKELKQKNNRNQGHWTEEECTKLVDIVKAVNEAVGNDAAGYEAPWDIVCEKMGGTRTPTQCRKKWQTQLYVFEQARGKPSRFQSSDRRLLVRKIRQLGLKSEDEIDWDELASGVWSGVRGDGLQKAFNRMKKAVPDVESLAFNDLLDAMIDTIDQRSKSAPDGSKKRSSSTVERDGPASKEFVTSDMED